MTGRNLSGDEELSSPFEPCLISIIAHLRSKSRGQADSVLLCIPYDSSRVTLYKEQSN